MRFKMTPKAVMAAAVCGLFAAGALPAFAQNPGAADLNVTGTIVPGACRANFDKVTLDFGNTKVADLPDNGTFNALTAQSTNLSVTCPSARLLSFSVQDLKAGTQLNDTFARTVMAGALIGPMDAAEEFGLGTTEVDGAKVKLGSYAVAMQDRPTVDGKNALNFRSVNAGTSWSAGPVYLRDGYLFGAGQAQMFGDRPVMGTETLSAGSKFVFPLKAVAVLNLPSALRINRDVSLDGQLAFAIHYQ